MSQVVKYEDKYRARWRDPDGRQRSKVFGLKKDAEAFLDSINHKMRRNEYVDPRAGNITVREWCERWRKVQVNHRPSTAATVETYFRRHVYPTLGDRPLNSLLRSDVQAWVADRSKVLAPGSVEQAYRWFYSALDDAVSDRVISRSPCENIGLPEREEKRIKPMTVPEVAAMADAITDRYRAAVVLAAGAGLRLGEVFGLHVHHVDFMARTITVEQQLITPNKGAVRIGPPKTKTSNRVIAVADVVLLELSAHMAKYPPVDGFIFTTSEGNPVIKSTFQSAWKRARRDTGLSHVRFHDLRHHFASALIAGGCSVKVVQEYLGHASASETLDTYSHLWEDDDDRAREAIQRQWTTTESDDEMMAK